MTATDAETTGATAAPDAGVACGAELGWGLGAMARAFGLWATESTVDLPGGPRGHLVLSTISLGRPSSQLALAHALGLDRTVMTYLIDELESAGLVERRPDPSDRRVRQILITDAGRAAQQRYGAELRRAEQRLLAPLDEHEAAAFRTMISRVAMAAAGATGGGCPSDIRAACSE